MGETCSLLPEWELEKIVSFWGNISANITEEIMMPSALCSTFQLITALTYVVQILGVICNVISFAVLSRIPTKSAFRYCLTFLTGFEITFLLSSSIKLLLGNFIGVQANYLAVLIVLQSISWTGSVWATAGVSAERFISAFFVFRANSLCTYRRTVYFNMFILCFAVTFNIPLFQVLQNIQWDADLITIYLHLYSKYGKPAESHVLFPFLENTRFFEIYYLYVNVAVMYCLPLLSVTILSICIYFVLRKADRIRRAMTSSRGMKRCRFQVHKPLVTGFLVTYFVALSFEISYSSGVSLFFTRLTKSFGCFLISANCSMKIFIYVSQWEDFRDTMQKIKNLLRPTPSVVSTGGRTSSV